MHLRFVFYLALLALAVPSLGRAQLQPTTARPSWLPERPSAERGGEAAESGGGWRPSRSEVGERPTLRVWAPPPLPPGPRTAPPTGSWRPPSDVPTMVPPGWTGPAQRVTSWGSERQATAPQWAPPRAGGPRSGSADSIGGSEGGGGGPPPAPWRSQLGGRAAAAIAPWCPDGKCSSRAAAGGLGSHEYGGSQAASALCPGCGSRATIVQSRGRDGGDATLTEIQPPGETEIPMSRIRSGVPARPADENAARSGARWGATRSAFHTNAHRAWGPSSGSSGSDTGGAP